MKIIVNGDYTFEVPNTLIVKDKKLYNTETKEYEGVEGDIVALVEEVDGKLKRVVRGSVDGFTHGSYAKIRGVDTPYKNVKAKEIDHVSTVKEADSLDELEKIMEVSEKN